MNICSHDSCPPVAAEGSWQILRVWDLERLRRFPHESTHTLQIGPVLATHFDQVEYFRRIHGLTAEHRSIWPDLTIFFEQFGQSFLLDLHPGDESLVRKLSASGQFEFCYRTSRLVRSLVDPAIEAPLPRLPGVIDVIPVDQDSISLFADVYLFCFEANSTRPEIARDNLSALLGIPGWQPYLVLVNGRPAGCYSSFQLGAEVALCAAATLPAYRNQGLQKLLIARRLNEARARGALRAVAQGRAGSVSVTNLKQLGFVDAEQVLTFRHRFA